MGTSTDYERIELLLDLGESELGHRPRIALEHALKARERAGAGAEALGPRIRRLTGDAKLDLGDIPGAIEEFSGGLESPALSEGSIEHARLTGRLAAAQLVGGGLERCSELVAEAKALASALDDRRVLAECLETEAAVLQRRGDSTGALELRQRALELAQGTEDQATELRVLIGLSQLAATAGNLTDALDQLNDVVHRASESGLECIAIMALNTLALTQNRMVGPADTADFAREALQRAEQIGARYLEADARRILFGVLRTDGDPEEARQWGDDTAALMRECGARLGALSVMSGLAELHMKTGNHEAARSVSVEILEAATAIDVASAKMFARRTLARCHSALGNHADAIATAEQAVLDFEPTGDHLFLSSAHETASDVCAAAGEFEKALRHFRLHHEHRSAAHAEAAERRLTSSRVQHWVAKVERDAGIMSRDVLDSLSSRVAVLDSDGNIIHFNESWARAAREADTPIDRVGEGVNYLDVCRAARTDDSPLAGDCLRGIEVVLQGRRERYSLEYPCDSPDQLGWFELTVTPLHADPGGAVIAHHDLSARREAEVALANALQRIQILKDRLETENVYLSDEIRQVNSTGEIVGESEVMQTTFYLIEQVAKTDVSVLLLGETGTGKEVVARKLHAESRRSDRPLVKVDCAALPAALIERELLGHADGAFTGATGAKPGRFEVADGGTIFFDEVGELPLELQTKLLRFLQDGEFERLGSTETQKVDVRVIAATNRNLHAAVRRGEFRADLYYRLNIFPITLPPLRDREGDVARLVWHFIRKGAERHGRSIERVPDEVMSALESYAWPGNVRELAAVIERALILSPGRELRVADPLRPSPATAPATATLAERERGHIESALRDCGWRIKGAGNAAERLGIPPSTLRHRMKKLGIRRPDGPPPPVAGSG